MLVSMTEHAFMKAAENAGQIARVCDNYFSDLSQVSGALERFANSDLLYRVTVKYDARWKEWIVSSGVVASVGPATHAKSAKLA